MSFFYFLTESYSFSFHKYGMLIFVNISFADFLYHVVVLVLTLFAFDAIKDQIFSCDCVGICSH
jgi:hypothetical protein